MTKQWVDMSDNEKIIDDKTYYFIKECKTMPKEVDVGTCWIGDKDTYEEIINNL